MGLAKALLVAVAAVGFNVAVGSAPPRSAASEEIDLSEQIAEELNNDFSDELRQLTSSDNTTSSNTTDSDSEVTTTADPTTDTETTTKAFKTLISADVELTTTLPAKCDTTAKMKTQTCEKMREAFVRGICTAVKANSGTNSGLIRCPGQPRPNFSGTVGVTASTLPHHRRQLEEAAVAEARGLNDGQDRTVTVSYQIIVFADTLAAAKSLGKSMKDAIVSNEAAINTRVKADVRQAILNDNIQGVDVKGAKSKAPRVETGSSQVIDSFAARAFVSIAALVAFISLW